MSKVPASTITITPAEGYHNQPGPFTLTGPSIWKAAQDILRLVAHFNEVTPDMLGALKTDFTITWADGETYEGTFGLTHDDQDLAAHISGYLSIMATRLREHAHLARTYAPLTAESFDEYLATYAIGD